MWRIHSKESPVIRVERSIIDKIKDMITEKSPGPSGITIVMLKIYGRVDICILMRFFKKKSYSTSYVTTL